MRGENPHTDHSPDTVFISKPTLKALETPGRPFLHDVNPPPRAPSASGDETGSPALEDDRFGAEAALVEPDGLEPTTSCLQSTRSTN